MTAEPLPRKRNLPTTVVAKRVDLTADHFKLWLERPAGFDFLPGQYITVGVDGIERPYSIVSSPREPLIELFVERIPPPEGKLTPRLHALRVGDSVTIRPRAKGVFLLRPAFRNHLFIATVTGIAPFMSMLRHWAEAPYGELSFYVLDGASYMEQFCYDDELRALAALHPSVRFVPTCSRPADPRNAGWRGVTGRVNLIAERFVKEWGLRPEDTCIYACGHPQMIADVKARFGHAFEVAEERYWKER
ncbi:MAG TPA: FAD-binding oxidoreductase [Gammaproteobacteria bacterium]